MTNPGDTDRPGPRASAAVPAAGPAGASTPVPTIGPAGAPDAWTGAWPTTPAPVRVSAPGVVAAVGVVGAAILLVAVRETLAVFIVGLLLAYVLSPLVRWMAAHRVPRGVATLIAIGVLAVFAATLTILFVETVASQAASFLATLPTAFAQLGSWVSSLGLPPAVEEDLLGFLQSAEDSIAAFDYSSLLGPLLSGLVGLLGAFFSLLVLPFFLFFVLAGAPTIYRSIQDVLPRPWRGDGLVVLNVVLESFGTYIRAEAIVAVIVGAMAFTGLMLLSVIVDPAFAEVALLLAIIAAFSELIPNLGPWIAAIPAVLFALTVSPFAVACTIILYMIVMFIEGQVLVPKIEGGAFSFHPALVLFLVVAGIALAGILGAIVVLPVTSAIWRTSRYAFRRASGQIPPAPPDGPYTDGLPDRAPVPAAVAIAGAGATTQAGEEGA